MAATYVQDKIDEEMIDAQIIDVVLYGSRFRGLEKNEHKSVREKIIENKSKISENGVSNEKNKIMKKCEMRKIGNGEAIVFNRLWLCFFLSLVHLSPDNWTE